MQELTSCEPRDAVLSSHISLCVASLCYLLFLFYVRALGVWEELASHKRLFNPPPQFSRLGIQCPILCCIIVCLSLFVVV